MTESQRRLPRPLGSVLRIAAWVASLVALALVLWALDARRMPELEPWHTVELDDARAGDLQDAELERYLAPVVRLGAASLTAFYYEVIVPIAKTLGFITVQTLG